MPTCVRRQTSTRFSAPQPVAWTRKWLVKAVVCLSEELGVTEVIVDVVDATPTGLDIITDDSSFAAGKVLRPWVSCCWFWYPKFAASVFVLVAGLSLPPVALIFAVYKLPFVLHSHDEPFHYVYYRHSYESDLKRPTLMPQYGIAHQRYTPDSHVL
uniref:Uncharacterized protein n=1 Tax=Glossina palpalis gambiensis TaxID=67801 RepID=A0A1B0ASQ7_9MUSC